MRTLLYALHGAAPFLLHQAEGLPDALLSAVLAGLAIEGVKRMRR